MSSAQLKPQHIEGIAAFVKVIDSLRADLERTRLPEFVQTTVRKSRYFVHASKKEKREKQKNGEHTHMYETDDFEGSGWRHGIRLLQQEAEIQASQGREHAIGQPALREYVQRIQELQAKEKVCAAQKQANNGVILTTIHQAKGLQWKHVFVVRFNDGVLPLPSRGAEQVMNELRATGQEDNVNDDVQHRVAALCASNVEEERRLAYVAFTRAEEALVISMCARDKHGQLLAPSRFLQDIPEEFLHRFEREPTNNTATHLDSSYSSLAVTQQTAPAIPEITHVTATTGKTQLDEPHQPSGNSRQPLFVTSSQWLAQESPTTAANCATSLTAQSRKHELDTAVPSPAAKVPCIQQHTNTASVSENSTKIITQTRRGSRWKFSVKTRE